MPDTQTLPNPDCAGKALIERLKKRPDFLAAARDCSWATPGLVLQARNRRDQGAVRVGFTVTKKVGNAVVRNRIKRRLREAVRLALPEHASPGYDYVVIGRKGSLERDFDALKSDLALAIDKVHKGARRNPPAKKPRSHKRH
ncbi:MAG: ribonuclease P protein component [Hyphomicrobiales bacterium]